MRTKPGAAGAPLDPTSPDREPRPRGIGDRRLRLLWIAIVALAAAGLICWAFGAGMAALWLFVAATAGAVIALPLPYALLVPLFAGLLGWLVDMLSFLVLVGWGVVVLRWLFVLVIERRMPRGGRWTWIPIGLFAWTCLGVVVVPGSELKHFVLVVGMQFCASATVLLIVDSLADLSDRTRVAAGLGVYIVVLTIGVFMQWVGVPFDEIQDETVGDRLEEAYGLNVFTSEVGLIKWVLAEEAGAGELRAALKEFGQDNSDLPSFAVFLPKFNAFDQNLVVRFDGSARAFEDRLDRFDIDLVYDNVGVAPAAKVPRWRSFTRSALGYAGMCVALVPIGLYLSWTQTGRRRWLGRLATLSCLVGAAFSLARGAWVAILIGIVYLLVDGLITARRKVQMVGAFVVVVVLFTGLFLVLYGGDPLTVRARGESSIATREELYADTITSVGSPLNLVIGYAAELSRTESGGARQYGDVGKYLPRSGTHSTYLNYFFRTGIVGALGIIALYGFAILRARAEARRVKGADRTFGTLIAAAVLSAAAHAAILSLYVEPAYMLVIYIVIGLAYAGAVAARSSPAGETA